MHDEQGQSPPLSDGLASQIETFFQLSRTLSLTRPEEQALLDLPEGALEQLRTAPDAALQMRGPKLERRLGYAIPILQRMLASMMSQPR